MRKFQDFKWLAAGLALVALTACDGQINWSGILDDARVKKYK